MSWINLHQLDKCSQTKLENWVENKPKQLLDKINNKITRTLDWHISINLFFKNENGINRISQIKIWKFIRSNHPDWFTCVNPGNSVDKIWVLKNEFTPQARVILGEYVEKYKDSLWKHY